MPLKKQYSQLWKWLNRLLPAPSNQTLQNLSQRPLHPDLQTTGTQSSLVQARAAFEAQNYAESLVLFTQLTRQNDQNPWAWHGLGDSYQLLGNPTMALHAYSRAIKIQPNEGLHYGGRANAHHSLGNAHAEAQDWTTALTLNPKLVWMRPQSS